MPVPLSDNEDGLAKPNPCFNANPLASAAAGAPPSGLGHERADPAFVWRDRIEFEKSGLKAGARPWGRAFDVVIRTTHTFVE
jgi:hypothetical protein